jgi:chromosome transmission fidelity protein 4
MKLLSLEKSMKGAIKLVTALKLPNLAERFNSILEVKPITWKRFWSYFRANQIGCFSVIKLGNWIFFLISSQERLVNESKGTYKSPLLNSNDRASLTADAAISKTMATSIGKNETPEPSIAFSSPTLSAPLFIKKANKQEHEKSYQNQTVNAKTSMEPSNAEKVKSAENVIGVEVKMTGEVLKVQSQRPSNPFLKSSNNQETSKKDLDQLTSPHPSNPFKKTPH